MAGFIVGFLLGGLVGVLLTGTICMGKIADLEWEIAKLKSRGRDNDR